MSKWYYLFLLLGFHFFAKAQLNEIGIFAGGSNYIGDVGSTNYIAPNQPVFGILYKRNLSKRHSLRASYSQTTLYGSDPKSSDLARKSRKYSFNNNIQEFLGGLEFNFFDFNLHEADQKITPYVFSGLSYLKYDDLYVLEGKTKKGNKVGTTAIPIILGIKAHIKPQWVLGIEVGARYTFTDNLDGSNPKNKTTNLEFGNTNSNDWYVFSGITLTYTFGRKPCYCKE